LSIRFEDGKREKLFVKYLGSEQSDHPDKQCRDREIQVYEQFLKYGNLPVVGYRGFRWNSQTSRHELFVEYVDDWSLKYHELEHWFTAAGELAKLHIHFAAKNKQLIASKFLLRIDAGYLRDWSGRALTTVNGRNGELGSEFGRILARCQPAIEVIAKQPLTLVHNDLSPKNVLAVTSCKPARICFIDWEMAGIGCGLLDLVHLKYGLKPADDERMRATYSAAMAGTGLLPSDPQNLRRLFLACELHQTVYRLAFSDAWNLPTETVKQWVTEAGQLLSQLCDRSGAEP
jgi:Ser/Thr protein kinase RdoA (MazF antagonist)